MFNITFFAFVSLCLAPLVHSYSNPGACSGACYAHDPSIIQRSSDGLYFKFNTGGGIEFATATSLSGPWTTKGKVLPSGSKIKISGNAGTDAWAPDVHKVGSLYHCYYAISTFGSQVSTIGLATSSTMDAGSWTDKGSIGLASTTGNSYNAIDPNLIVVGGTNLMNFGSFWSDIFQVSLDSTATAKSSASAYQLAFNSGGTHAEEGSYMFYYGGYYYLTWSAGICCGYDTSKPAAGAEYKIMICRSTSATGGFVDKNGAACKSGGGSVLLASHGTTYGPGGQGVFTDSSLGLVLYYHYAKTTVGLADASYLFGWNKLSWSGGWPSV